MHKVVYADKLINIYFICKNDSPLEADRVTNIQKKKMAKLQAKSADELVRFSPM